MKQLYCFYTRSINFNLNIYLVYLPIKSRYFFGWDICQAPSLQHKIVFKQHFKECLLSLFNIVSSIHL